MAAETGASREVALVTTGSENLGEGTFRLNSSGMSWNKTFLEKAWVKGSMTYGKNSIEMTVDVFVSRGYPPKSATEALLSKVEKVATEKGLSNVEVRFTGVVHGEIRDNYLNVAKKMGYIAKVIKENGAETVTLTKQLAK